MEWPVAALLMRLPGGPQAHGNKLSLRRTCRKAFCFPAPFDRERRFHMFKPLPREAG
jgi:hypothetical protein